MTLGEDYFIQRMYVGIEPEEQTSRELKDKYGTLAYAVSGYKRLTTRKDVQYKITIDGEVIETPAAKVYVVNASQTGTGISVTGDLSRSDDGLLEVFISRPAQPEDDRCGGGTDGAPAHGNRPAILLAREGHHHRDRARSARLDGR